MSELRSVDLAGLLPTDFVEGGDPWPGVPEKMGAYVGDSGLQSFASRNDYTTPVEITVCDSDPRVHLSVWLCDGVDIRTSGWSGRINGLDAVAGFLPGKTIEHHFRGKAHHVGLMFSPETLEMLAGDEGLCFFDLLRGRGGLHVTPSDSRTLRAAHDLDQLLLSERPARLFCEAKCLELLGCFLEQGRGCAMQRSPDQERLRHARELLLADLTNPPTIAELARACGLNSLKLKRGFKALFGLPIHALYRQERMRVAWDLVQESNLSITEIGAHIGYQNLSHFSAAFHRQFGVLPSILRRKA
ncbi:helix-turn-helix domain-containing protein [Pseudomonas matsuisoli]|uniref:AraC family transcriptional regulator n=1 Tax=Pseudomonas matsuisoli TaxID=1515666 RepID=A0A917PQC1_9PSED|nr:AraC family transcriptional regulator [Pseudomonas matsuisoli]GGJ86972.1 AraC family transcriptional regulator [Pseudomonas matsuisoli]